MIAKLKLFLLALFSSDFKFTFKPENLTAVDGKFNLIFSDIIFPCFKKFLSRTITAICLCNGNLYLSLQAIIRRSMPRETPTAGVCRPPSFFARLSYLPPAQKVF